ncbi:hypothetical protein [Thioclava electrotropha]|uniref:hypothetical protein n=1 Tax=Thioclava electrotropha TaxID=1549850 RepID=UPI0023A8188C|nr:hypothetical protein [Thioclava electrotropha]
MRAFTKRHSDAKFVEDYIFRDGTELIGGTLIAEGRRDLRLQFEELSRSHAFLHTTLSLPAGLFKERDDWLRIALTQLELMGLPPFQIPWVGGRHIDASCDHIHLAYLLMTFTGMPLKPRLSRRGTDRNHQRLAKLLGLPVPEYFDPSVPTLTPPTPQRNLKSKNARQLHAALSETFAQSPPTTIEMLADRLRDRDDPIEITVDQNVYGRESYLFETSHGALYGGKLGAAWEPRHLRTRLDLAMALSVVGVTLSLRAIRNQLKELTDAKRTDHAETRDRPDGDGKSPDRDRRENGKPDGAARTSEIARDRAIGIGQSASGRPFDDDNGTWGEQEHPPHANGRPQFDRGATRGTRSAAERAGETGRQPREETRSDPEDLEPANELSFGAWLARVLHLLRSNFRKWRWQKLADRPALGVMFEAGDRAIVSSQGVAILKNGPDAARLASLFEPGRPQAIADTETGGFPAPEPSPYDDGPGI